jgi:hypothetical protein
MAICEYFSTRKGREMIVLAPTYWLGLWLEWSPEVVRYVERPGDAEDPDRPLSDYWVQLGARDLLVDVRSSADKRPLNRQEAEPWRLDTAGFEQDDDGATVNDDWLWSRRTLLLNLEKAHPFSVAAHLRGGLKASCRQIVACLKGCDRSIGELQAKLMGDRYVALCALFNLTQRGVVSIDWDKPLSLDTRIRRVVDAP